MARFSILYTQDAVDDLDSIFDYIEEDKREAAVSMLERIENSILMLADNPRMGTVLPTDDLSLINPGYRYLVVKPYIVFYRIGKEAVFIARVLHSRQNWMHLLFESPFEDV